MAFKKSSSIDALEALTDSLVDGHLKHKKFPLEPCVVMSNLIGKTWKKCLFYPTHFIFTKTRNRKKSRAIAWILIDINYTRNALIFVNFNYMYLKLYKIPLPSIYIHDRNFLPTDMNPPFENFIEIFMNFQKYIVKKYFEIIKQFGLVNPKRINYMKETMQFSCSSLELNIELINFGIPHLVDICSNLRGNIKATYLSDNLTIYCNPTRKTSNYQLKIYQKTYNMLRVEITANRLKYFIIGPRLTKKRFTELFDRSFVRGLKDFGLNFAILTEKKKRINFPYDWLFNVIRKHLKVNATEFIYILINNTFKSNGSPEVQKLFRRLVSKKLVKKHHRGVYYPTSKLYGIKNLFRFIDPAMLSYNANQSKMFPFEYALAFNFDHHKDPLETFENAKFFHDNFSDSLIYHQR